MQSIGSSIQVFEGENIRISMIDRNDVCHITMNKVQLTLSDKIQNRKITMCVFPADIIFDRKSQTA